jgi:hypothetical protein
MRSTPTDRPELARWLQLQGEADRRILAQMWGLSGETDPAILARALTEPERVRTQWEHLAEAERAALTRVLQEGGALPVAILQREWGIVRDPANFSNPRAYLQALDAPASPAERLYTMGLLVREHSERGPVYRVLNDLRHLLPTPPPRDLSLRPVPLPEPEAFEAGENDLEIVDRTLLALLLLADERALMTLQDGALNKASLARIAGQMGFDSKLRGVRREAEWLWIAIFRTLAVEAGLLARLADGTLELGPQAEPWLRSDRAGRIAALVRAWLSSPFDELSRLCSLSIRGMGFGLRLPEARRLTRQMISTLPAGIWFDVAEIVTEIEQVEPDFLRRDGRYDIALIYDERGQLVAGRERWDRVEGEFLRATLLGMFHWLGLTDIVRGDRQAIRLTPLAAHLLHGAPAPPEPEPALLSVQGTFEVICPPGAPLVARFQLARIGEIVSEDTATIFRLTRRSVLRAAERGISAEAILHFLEEHGRAPVPQAVAAYIHDWTGQVGQLRLEEAALLRAEDAHKLAEVRRTRGVTLPPIEELTPTTWKIAPGDTPALLHQLQKAGWSVEGATEEPRQARGGRKATLSDHDLKALVTAAYAYANICAELGLPCEISGAMLSRLQKLVPSRHVEASWSTGQQLRKHLRAAREQPQEDNASPSPGRSNHA